jgi:zinc/manganese transport system permease protein
LFDLLRYQFIQNAFLAGSIVAILSALLGYFVVVRGLSFAGHALSSIGFAGAAGAVLIGVPPVYGLLVFTVLASLAISVLSQEIRERDISTGVIMTFSLGFGILFLSLYHGYAQQAYSILFGTIVGISSSDVILTALVGIFVLIALAILVRPLLFSSYDPELAESRGVPVLGLGAIFLVIVALTMSVAMQVVGILLVFALLIGPAATATRLLHRPAYAIALAMALSLIYTWIGILLAANSAGPVSFFITTLSFGVYVLVRLLPRPRASGTPRWDPSDATVLDRDLKFEGLEGHAARDANFAPEEKRRD